MTTPGPLRDRMPIIVSTSGKAQLATPSSSAHTQGAAAGAAHSPAKPTSWKAPSTTTIGPCERIRAASGGSTKDSGTPITMVTASSRPALSADSPASRKICGIQPIVT